MDSRALGIKTRVSGRLNGVEMAREEGYLQGTIAFSTIRSDIDFAIEEAYTTSGIIGVKV
jgi:ribosomal protein S3